MSEIIKAVSATTPRFKKLPQYPEVQRDLAFVIPQDITFSDIQKIIKKSILTNIFKGSEIFDVYQGEHIKEGFKSVAFRVKMQDEKATLTDEIIDSQMKSLKMSLQKTFKDISFRE